MFAYALGNSRILFLNLQEIFNKITIYGSGFVRKIAWDFLAGPEILARVYEFLWIRIHTDSSNLYNYDKMINDSQF